jgi:hypothetical protein
MRKRTAQVLAIFVGLAALIGTPVASQQETAATIAALDTGIAKKRAVIDAYRDESCTGIGKLLDLMFDVDQFARFSLLAICPSAERSCMLKVWPSVAAVDGANLKRLKPIVAAFTWRDLKRCGGHDGQTHAWLLIQHADADKPFQRDVLAKMRDAFLAGEVSGTDYAYLVDRVASGDRRPQTFGTQGTCVAQDWKPDPVLAPEGLDERRREVGLAPEAEYARSVQPWCKGSP